VKPKSLTLVLILIAFSLPHFGMARNAQYDEEARQIEREEKAALKASKQSRSKVKNFAGGVKQATYDSTTGLISDTAEGGKETPVVGAVEGARRGSKKVLDNTVKGAVKVATLGYGNVDSYEVEEPESGTDEPTKIKLAF
jgi:hypothetical protein